MNRLTSEDIEFLKSIVDNSTKVCISESRAEKLMWDGYIKKETLTNNEKTFFRLTQRGMEVIKKGD